MKYLFLISFVLTTSFCFSQEDRIEKIYQDCVYSQLTKEEASSLKRYIKGFEKHLVEINLLEDATGKSYIKLIKSLPQGKKIPSSFSYSFIDSLNLIKSQNMFRGNNKCTMKISKHKDFESYKKKVLSLIPSNSNDINKVMENYAGFLKEEDFNLDYYKKQFFLILDLFGSFDDE